MSKNTKTGKEFGTVNNLIARWQVPKETTAIVEPVTPQPMKPGKRVIAAQKFIREIPIPRDSYPLLMNQEAFCKLMGIKPETAAQWRVTFEIPHIRLPHRIFYRVEDVQDFLERHTVLTLKPKDGSPKSEVQSQKSEVGSQKSEVRSSPKSEVGNRKSEVGSPKSEVKRS